MLATKSRAALLGVNEANAKSPTTTILTSFCSSNGYSPLPVRQADTCDAARHNDSTDNKAHGTGILPNFVHLAVTVFIMSRCRL